MDGSIDEAEVDSSLLSEVSNRVDRSKDLTMINPVKIRSKRKFYKLQKSGTLCNKSGINSVGMIFKDSNSICTVYTTDKSQQNDSSHAEIDDTLQILIVDEFNESSPSNLPLNNVINKSCCESSVAYKNSDHRRDQQQEGSFKLINAKHVPSKKFADSFKKLTEKYSYNLDNVNLCQKKDEKNMSKKRKFSKNNLTCMVSPGKKRVLLKKKCDFDIKCLRTQPSDCSDEVAIATNPLINLKQKVSETLADKQMLSKIECGPVDQFCIGSDTTQLKGSEAFEAVCSSSTDIPTMKDFGMTLIDEIDRNLCKQRSLSVKAPVIITKQKQTLDCLIKDSPKKSRHSQHEQFVETRCSNTVGQAPGQQNDATIPTTDLLCKEEIEIDPANISGNLQQNKLPIKHVVSHRKSCKNILTNHRSRFIPLKPCSDSSSLLIKDTSDNIIIKADKIDDDSSFATKPVQYDLCTELQTPSKCVVVLPEELRYCTDESATLLSENSTATKYTSEAIQNLGVLAHKRCRELSPGKMSPVRLSKNLVSSPASLPLLTLDDSHVKPNDKMIIISELQQSKNCCDEIPDSGCPAAALEDQISGETVETVPSPEIFHNGAFCKSNKRCPSSMLSSVCPNDANVDSAPTLHKENLESYQDIPMTENREFSVCNAEGPTGEHVPNCPSNVFKTSEIHHDFGDSITAPINNNPVTNINTTTVFHAKKSPTTSCTLTSREATLGTPSHNNSKNEADLSLYLSSDEHDACAADCSLNESGASFRPDSVNVNEKTHSDSTNTNMMEKKCLDSACVSEEIYSEYTSTDTIENERFEGTRTTSDGSSPGNNCAALNNDSSSRAVNRPAADKKKKEMSDSVTTRSNMTKLDVIDQSFCEKYLDPSHSTIFHESTVPKQVIKSEAMKEGRQGKNCTATRSTVKKLNKMTVLEKIKPKQRLQRTRRKLKHRVSGLDKNVNESVENEENLTSVVTDVLMHAHSDQYRTPEKLCEPSLSPLTPDTRARMALRSASKSIVGHLPVALNDPHSTLHTSLYKLRLCSEQNPSSLHWFSEVATTYADGGVGSADLQRLNNVCENEVPTDVSKDIQHSSNIISPPIVEKDLNKLSESICPVATSSLPSTLVTKFSSTSSSKNHPIHSLNRNTSNFNIATENYICETNLTDGRRNLQEESAENSSHPLQVLETECPSTPMLGTYPSIKSLFLSDEVADFEGFLPADMVRKNIPESTLTLITHQQELIPPSSPSDIVYDPFLAVSSTLAVSNSVVDLPNHNSFIDVSKRPKVKNSPASRLCNVDCHSESLSEKLSTVSTPGDGNDRNTEEQMTSAQDSVDVNTDNISSSNSPIYSVASNKFKTGNCWSRSLGTNMNHSGNCISDDSLPSAKSRRVSKNTTSTEMSTPLCQFRNRPLVKNTVSGANTSNRHKSEVQRRLSSSAASYDSCSDASSTEQEFINRSSCERMVISRRKRTRRESSYGNLGIEKSNSSRILKLKPTRVTRRKLTEHTSSGTANVSPRDLKGRAKFGRRFRNMTTKTVNPVRPTVEKDGEPSSSKSIIPPSTMNVANVSTNIRSISNSTVTTDASPDLEVIFNQSSPTSTEDNRCTTAENELPISINKNMSIEKTFNKSTCTSFDIQDHSDNDINTFPEGFLPSITCNRTGKGCTIRCPDQLSDPPGTPYECLTCSIRSFNSLVSLLQHIMVVHANAPHSSVGGSDRFCPTPSDRVHEVAQSLLEVESNHREPNEPIPVEGIGSPQREIVDCNEGNAELSVSQAGRSNHSAPDNDTESNSNKRSKNNQNGQEFENSILNSIQRNDTDQVNRTNNKTGGIHSRKSKTANENERKRVSDNGNDPGNYCRREKRKRSAMDKEQWKTSAVNSKRSRPRDARSNGIETVNHTKIEPNHRTSSNTQLDNTEVEENVMFNCLEGDNKCTRKQHSPKRKRKVGRKPKSQSCLPMKEEAEQPVIVKNPCRPRKGFVTIPNMTKEDVQRLLSVQRQAFNETFKKKRWEIIARNEEAGIDLKKQAIMVNGTKRYQCDKCTTSVLTVPLLLNHMVTHYSSELAEFSCAFCPKTFHYGSALKLHLEKHADIMRFTCPICELGFQQEAKMRYHIMLHAKKKRTVFACKKCGQKFNSTALLAGHSKVHYPNLQYRCRLCDFVCIGRGPLSTHLKAEHKRKV